MDEHDERTDEILGITRCVKCGQRLDGEIECPFCSIVESGMKPPQYNPISKLRLILRGQLLHSVLLAILLAASYLASGYPGALAGEYTGLTTTQWLLITIALPIVHQLYVLIFWRLELHMGLISRMLGRASLPLYAAGFFVLIILRPVTILALAISNRGSLAIPTYIGTPLSFVLGALSLWLIVSVKLNFGFVRATGADHFDPRYRHMPFVRKGIHRLTPNAMYVFGPLIMWLPAVTFGSSAALISAAFTHTYIWVHYWCTERPDMQYIYGRTASKVAEDQS